MRCVMEERQTTLESIYAVNRKQIHLGYFKEDEFELAVKARKEAELKYFGEFARQNE